MPTRPSSCPPLAESFGYFGYSNTNTLALIQKLGLARHDSHFDSSLALGPEAADEVHRNMEHMPDRRILDFLVQYFINEINWTGQLVHGPWFLAKYKIWCTAECIKSVPDVDFTILLLRVCSYALQFLPSPSYPLDKIRGVLLADVRSSSDETADKLEAISMAADGRGSLIRVQQLAFVGLKCQIEGKIDTFWEVLGRAIRVAQSVGIHSEAARSRKGMDKTDQEMERRTFCNLFIWDSLLSRQLDRIPFLHGRLGPENWPQLHLLKCEGGGGGTGDSIESDVDAPDPFAERLLQAHLADFWRSVGPAQGAEYDVMAAEERYDRFCRDYLSQLPPAFALVDPDETWDKRFPKLPLQRKHLHIAIYDSLCWNFRPLFLRQPLPLPSYKSVVLRSQIKSLAVAALQVMDGLTQLHALLGGCHARLAGIVSSTFEAAVVLLYLLMDPTFPEDCPSQYTPSPAAIKKDPLQAATPTVTRLGCLQAAQRALKRLKMLAEVSKMADLGASILVQLFSKISETSRRRVTDTDEVAPIQGQEVVGATTTTPQSELGLTSAANEVSSWLPRDPMDLRSASGFVSISGTLAAGEMAPWPSFDDTLNMYSQDTEYFCDE
ncbi:fungal specific transcription factor [Hirsutella rhossiliensis]|uniref:Fungal specific transcription factor domain-containing protein n=1 Tax=Hirsutella rhossiliensis TaxID=111463 RepID=A0A9P8N3F8_9HYPO|nr:fungal specific transcription factor domain-containing protein [Hirsutella rhossiliensis]KAH0964002.1 fungal specific transcription factor domain-containing protein [Hirsutella rhossiliensis]